MTTKEFIRAYKDKKFISKKKNSMWYGMSAESNYQREQYIQDSSLNENMCRVCKSSFDVSTMWVYVSYWSSIKYPCCRECIDNWKKEEYYKQEVLDCQNIDQACNDCIFFKRMNKIWNKREWLCTKLNVNVVTQPNACHAKPCNWELFKHRKEW